MRHVGDPAFFLILVLLTAAAGCGGNDSSKSGPKGGLIVSDPKARSCEVVLDDADRAVDKIVFGEGVEGHFLREGPRVATAFFSKTDAAPASRALALELKAGANVDKVQVAIGRCFDRAGQLLAAATVEVVR